MLNEVGQLLSKSTYQTKKLLYRALESNPSYLLYSTIWKIKNSEIDVVHMCAIMPEKSCNVC